MKNATKHAEIVCIDSMTERGYKDEDYSNLILFVSCEPCIMCAYALALISKNL